MQKTKIIALWVLGLIFAVSGLASLRSAPIAAILSLIAAAILLPPVSRIAKEKFNFSLSRNIKIAILILLVIGIGITVPSSKNKPVEQPGSVSTSTPDTVAATSSMPTTSQAKLDAKAQLNELMEISKKAGLVTTNDFATGGATVYADQVWYTRTVQFKKDWLAKIGTLKEQAYGYRHFEVRDAYTNEKIAEVTAFSGALEVYK